MEAITATVEVCLSLEGFIVRVGIDGTLIRDGCGKRSDGGCRRAPVFPRQHGRVAGIGMLVRDEAEVIGTRSPAISYLSGR